jgi:phosphoribosylanthranilate isomerase
VRKQAAFFTNDDAKNGKSKKLLIDNEYDRSGWKCQFILGKKMIIQIYEIQDPDEAEKMIQEGVDHIGSVILSEEEWKKPSIYDTMRIIGDSPSKSSLIPLFNKTDSVFRVLDYYQPDIVHFCENLCDIDHASDVLQYLIDLQQQVRERFSSIKIMRSIPIPEPGKGNAFSMWEMASLFEPVSDYFLTDTLLGGVADHEGKPQPVEGFVGITGRTCDWEIARELVKRSRIPVILAGGLSPENVFQGIIQVAPAGVDSCTGTNMSDRSGKPIRFRKDVDRVREFVGAVRNLEIIK